MFATPQCSQMIPTQQPRQAKKTPLRPEFTLSLLNLGRPSMRVGGRGKRPGMDMGTEKGAPQRAQQMQRKEPWKNITSVPLNNGIELKKAETVWKLPTVKEITHNHVAAAVLDNDLENLKTQELLGQVRSILNKLTPEMFQRLMKRMTALPIDTEERLRGVIDLIFEKAISEPSFSEVYAKMCHCLTELKVQAQDKSGANVNFSTLLLNRCHKEFEKDMDDNEIIEKKQKELEATSGDEEKQLLSKALTDAKDKARRRSLGNIKFIGELFKVQMLTEDIMHDCVVKLLNKHDEESLECLCRLLSTMGKDLDFKKSKLCMDQYFQHMEKIIKEKKISSRIRFMLQDVLELRQNNWVPRRGDQGPKTIAQIHKQAELEDHREQMKVQQALISKEEYGGGPGRMGWRGPGVLISKNRPINASRHSTRAKPADSGSRPATSTLNRFSALQHLSNSRSSSMDSDRKIPQRNCWSREHCDRLDRQARGGGERSERQHDWDRNRLQVTKCSFSRENEERNREKEQHGAADPVGLVARMTEDRGCREQARSKESVKRETPSTPPPPLAPTPAPTPTDSSTPTKPALSEEALVKKSKAIIEEYLHLNDMKEALQCVRELNSTELLFVFVRDGLELTLERRAIARERMGLLLHQLLKTSVLPTQQYYKGLQVILEVAEDMAIDIPHFWLYLAEQTTPMLQEGGIPMGNLFREISKPLIPLGKAGVLLAHILNVLCKGMSHEKAGTMWREAGLQWKDFLPEDVDVHKFVTEQNVEFTLGDETEKSLTKELSTAELTEQLEKLLQNKADNLKIIDLVEEQVVVPPEPEPAPAQEPQHPAASPPALEEADLSREDKEVKLDKLDAENIQPDSPQSSANDKKFQYKKEQWNPVDPEEMEKYEFHLNLPAITNVVRDKAKKTPLRQLDLSRRAGLNCRSNYTPSLVKLGRPSMRVGCRGPRPGMDMGTEKGAPQCSQQMQRKEPWNNITSVPLNNGIELKKAETVWKLPTVKEITHNHVAAVLDNDLENLKTQELLGQVHSILNKLTPEMFQKLMKRMTALPIDTEERLRGVIDLIFEKAISEPSFSEAYAKMCHCLTELKVQAQDKSGANVNFRTLLLNRCQKEFEKDMDDNEIIEKKQKELEATSGDEEKQLLSKALTDTKDKAQRRSLGNIKFIGELFKVKMLAEAVMHKCVVKLLNKHDEESLECLCRLLSTIGKDLDFKKSKLRMDQYFQHMEKIIKEKISSRIRFMLQDVLELRQNNWVPRRGDQGPKTIAQTHKQAELEDHREQMKVQQALISKEEYGGGPGRMGWRGPGVPISKNRPINASRHSTSAKPADSGSRPATSTLNRFSALQHLSTSPSSSMDSDRKIPQRNCWNREHCDRLDRQARGGGERSERQHDWDRNRLQVTKCSFSRENEERNHEKEQHGAADPVDPVARMTEDHGRREQARSKESVKRETPSTPPPPLAPTPAPTPTDSPTPTKPALSEEALVKKSKAIIEEYLHLNDMKEALQCVRELNSTELLFVFVRDGLELTLERRAIARERMGLLLHQLLKTSVLPTQQYYKGLQVILEVAEDMAIDIPHFWLYLAEQTTPMLQEGGIPMGNLFREISKPLIPLGKAGVLLAHILNVLCKGMSHEKAGTMWREAGLQWKDFLPEDVDVHKFVTEQNVEFTLGDETEKSLTKELSTAELTEQLEKHLQNKADNLKIIDVVEEQVVVPPEPEPAPAQGPQHPAASPPASEEADLSREDKEDKLDKLDAENIQPDSPQSSAIDKKFQYKKEQWNPVDPEEMEKHEFHLNLPAITNVVRDKAKKTPLRQLDLSRRAGLNCRSNYTPSLVKLGLPSMRVGCRGPRPGMDMGTEKGAPQCSQQMQRKEPWKNITSVPLNNGIELKKAETVWKLPTVKEITHNHVAAVVAAAVDNDLENLKTQELLGQVHSILNKLTPEMFQKLMKRMTALPIDTEERLRGVIDLIFEKAISEPSFSEAYAKMCHCLTELKVQAQDKSGANVNFRTLLLNRCQKEFEKDMDDNEIIEKKQKELEATSGDEEKQLLSKALTDAKDKARRRSLGNIKFIGELFKVKMLAEGVMHKCVVKLLNKHDEESLECLCRLLSTIGKDLDFKKSKLCMDQYFQHMEKIIKEKKISSRIRFMLQDVLELRQNNWVRRRGDQGPKTIAQTHKQAELQDHRQQMKVQQALISKEEYGGGPGRMGWRGPGVPISKKRPINASRHSTRAKPADSGSRPATSTLNRFSALQHLSTSPSSSMDSDRKIPQRNCWNREHCDRLDRQARGGVKRETPSTPPRPPPPTPTLTAAPAPAPTPTPAPSLTKELSTAELTEQLEKLLQDKADNQKIIDWVEANLDEQQTSNMFVRVLMTCVCQAAIIRKKPFKLDKSVMKLRAGLLQRYLKDEQKELQALYALQALMVELKSRTNLLQMFFHCLYDEDVLTEEAFFKWESSKDGAERRGKGVALKSVTTFFVWLRKSNSSS